MESTAIRKSLAEFAAQGGDAARLTQQRRWVCWKRVPKKGGGFGKPPIDPETGHPMDIRTPEGRAKLFTAARALEALEGGKCDGIGIATGVFDGLPLVGMDIDHCINEDGTEKREYVIPLHMLKQSGYYEISPSGTGARGFALCRKPERFKTRSGGVEVYGDGQYLTLTGDRVKGANIPLNNSDAAVQYLCETFLKETPQGEPTRQTAQTAAATNPGERFYTVALSKDAQLISLWEGKRPNGNESSDDQALMNKLAYWLDCNEAAMTEAFKGSPHAQQKDSAHQKKLNRNDYLHRTAQTAIRGCRTTASAENAAWRESHQPTAGQGRPAASDGITKKNMPLRSFSSVDYEPPKWLIEPYVPRGKLTLVQGDTGVGKTAFACALAALVSTGTPLVGHAVHMPGNVLLLSVEDDATTLRGRIEASGGDVAKCFFPESAAGLTFTDGRIEGWVRDCGARLVIFDPLQSFLGAKVDMHKANETRPVLDRLAEMARRTDCAIVILSHMSKGSAGGKAVYRALGSIDIMSAMRSALYIGRNPDDESECVMVHIKSSNAKPGRSIAYAIGDRGGVTFKGYSSVTVEDIETAQKRQERGIDYDHEPLVQLFRKLITDKPGGGFLPYADLQSEGAKLLGYPPFSNTADLKHRLDGLIARELQQRDGIIVNCGVKQNGMRGVRLERYAVPDCFQTSWVEAQ